MALFNTKYVLGVKKLHHLASTFMATLYRLFNADGDLLYIGISANVMARFRTHAGEKHWWHEVASMRVEHHQSRKEASAAEVAAIKAEKPLHNVQGSKPLPRQSEPSMDPKAVYQREWRARHGARTGHQGRQASQPCGTPAAYRRHRRQGEEPCEDCRRAMSAWNREQYERRKAVRPD